MGHSNGHKLYFCTVNKKLNSDPFKKFVKLMIRGPKRPFYNFWGPRRKKVRTTVLNCLLPKI